VMPHHRDSLRTTVTHYASALGAVDDIEVADNRIQVALQLMEASPDFDFDAIAGTLNLSASRLRHLFSAQIGLSPGQYMKLIRLQQAKGLLESSFLTVKEIASRVGARDVSHFVRNYKAVYGETPGDARRRSILQSTRLLRSERLNRQLRLPFGSL
jgi:transcriptional regulator GlxA family with amidase domain